MPGLTGGNWVQAHLISVHPTSLCFTDVTAFFFFSQIASKTLHQQKDYDLLYCSSLEGNPNTAGGCLSAAPPSWHPDQGRPWGLATSAALPLLPVPSTAVSLLDDPGDLLTGPPTLASFNPFFLYLECSL